MKPIFGIDITTNKKNQTNNSLPFIKDTIPKELKEKIENASDKIVGDINKNSMPQWFSLLYSVTNIPMACFFAFLVYSLFFMEIKNLISLYVVGGVFFIGWVIMQIFYFRYKKKEKAPCKETIDMVEEYKKQEELAFKHFNLPNNAVELSLLEFTYKQKNNQYFPYSAGGRKPLAYTIENKAFVKNDKLYIVDIGNLYEFDLKGFGEIVSVKNTLCQPIWNVARDFSKEEIKKYKLRANKQYLFLDYYYMITYTQEDCVWGLYFPIYEIKKIENLTGIKRNKQK